MASAASSRWRVTAPAQVDLLSASPAPGHFGEAELGMDLDDGAWRRRQPAVNLQDLVPQVEGLTGDTTARQLSVQRRCLQMIRLA